MSTLALSACVVSTTGTAGAGGSSSTTGAGGTSGVGGGTGGETSGVGGGTGGGGCVSGYSCAEAITPPDGDPTKLCDGSDAAKAYDTLATCTCTGACAADCNDNVCMGMDISTACQTCLQDGMAGCGAEFTDCANN